MANKTKQTSCNFSNFIKNLEANMQRHDCAAIIMRQNNLIEKENSRQKFE